MRFGFHDPRCRESLPAHERASPVAISLAALLFAAVAGPGGAQTLPNGAEFQVNTYTTGSQRHSAIAVDGQGNVVVTWQSFGSSGTDISSWSIQAQRFDGNGTPVGDEFQVNTYSTSWQVTPAIAMDSQGNFVVAWYSGRSGGTDTAGYSIQAQRYDANGTPVGDELQVNTYTTSFQFGPAVGAAGGGDFVVAWTSDGSGGTDTDGTSIQAQRFGTDGAPVGDEFQVNTYTTSWQLESAVAADGEGNFVVAWTSNGSGGTDTDGMSIQARRYDALGNPLGGEFQVNTYTTGYQLRPALAVDGQGSFVVAWASFGSSGTDTDGYSIQAQRYDQNGAPVGGQFQVNTYTPYFQDESAIAADGSGGFVIAWTSDGSSGTDTDRYSIQAQRYDLNGALVGDQFQVNTYTTSWQLESAVAADDEGNFVVAWTSYGSGSADTDGTSIQAQRYDALFRDGVESGDTARWSATIP